MGTTVADEIRRDDTRHNFIALGLDYAFFSIGLSFASQATILPAFAAHLGAPNVVIGAIPAVMTLGWFLPSLFVAPHTESLPRKLPFMLRYTVWERIPLPLLAAVAFFLAEPAPRLALAGVLGLLLLMTGVSGALIPAWMEIIGRTIPTTLRGRFFGAANVLGSAGGLLGSVGTAYLLAAVPAPRSYGLCFLAGGAFLGLSYLALASAREPATGPPRPPVPLATYLRRIPTLLRRDRNLVWFLVARAASTLGAMGGGFYTVYALRAFDAPEWQVGVFTTVYLAGQMLGNVALGWLADRAGHRLVLVLGVGALAAGNLVALAAPSARAFGVVFLLAGVYLAAMLLSARTILLELAEDPDERPTYIGLANNRPRAALVRGAARRRPVGGSSGVPGGLHGLGVLRAGGAGPPGRARARAARGLRGLVTTQGKRNSPRATTTAEPPTSTFVARSGEPSTRA